MAQRPLHAVPAAVTWLLCASFALQISWGLQLPRPQAKAEELAPAPEASTLKLASLSEPVAAAQFVALYLQAFDNQPGISVPFLRLDYAQVEDWLARILELDPNGQYPFLMASQLYAQVPDAARQRQMLAFVHRNFFADPNRRWPWLAHAAIVAKHRLRDQELALQYAQAITRHATAPEVPHWASQMQIFILEDMGEAESAKILLGGLLASGSISDPHEVRFLTERLHLLETKTTREK